MPSASSAKPEKQASTEAAPSESSSTNSNQQNTPLKQAILIIGHKIRNLDKRKAKLETYRELQRSGKELHQDQKVAVAKYDEVMQTLEFARDLLKQFNNLCTVSEKETKKIARKEASLRVQQDLSKIREVLLVQDTLAQMGIEKVREDFLLGRNGATAITPEDLQLLDEFYPTVTPKHTTELGELGCPNDLPDYNTQVHNAAEQLLSVVDAKQKEFSNSTYAHLKEVIDTIQTCGYLEKPSVSNEEVEHPATETEWKATEIESTAIQDKEYIPTINATTNQECPVPEIDRIPDQMPPMPNFPPVPAEVVQPSVSVISSIIEHSQSQYYAPPAAVTPQQPRHISEILEAGNFYFLQDSELGEVDMLASAHQALPSTGPIPSQTFTNQSFTNVPNVVVPTIAGTPGAVYPTTNLPQPIPISSLHPAANPNLHPSQQPTVINASTFSPPKEFDTFISNQTKTENSRNDQKNGNEWSEQTESHRQFSSMGGNHSNRPRGNGGNKNNRSGGNNSANSGYYQNNYYPNNGYGGYKPRAGGNRPSGAPSGQRQNSGGGHKGSGSGSGQYSHRSKSSQQSQH